MDTRSLLFLSLEISHHLLHNELIIYANDTDTPQHGRDIENNTVVFWSLRFRSLFTRFFSVKFADVITVLMVVVGVILGLGNF